MHVEYPFIRGILISIFFFFFFPFMEEALALHWNVGTAANNPRSLSIAVGIDLLKLLIVILLVKFFLKSALLSMLWNGWPAGVDLIKWGLLGGVFSLVNLIPMALNYHLLFDKPNFIFFYALWLIKSVLIGPITEEVKYRGILYNTLRPKGKYLAIWISSIVFLMSHLPSYKQLFFYGNWGLSYGHTVWVFMGGLIAAYIYESTQKLSLCIWFHMMCNIGPSGFFIGYLIDCWS